MTKFATLDAACYLGDEETIAHCITAALEDPNPDVSLTAVRDVARVLKLLSALGVKLSASPAH